MREMNRALSGAKIAMTGYGLFGRALGTRLYALGAQTTVFLRNEEQMLSACSDGLQPRPYTDMPISMAGLDALINTVPAPVVGQEAALALPRNAHILETASQPGGFTDQARSVLGQRIIHLPAIPRWYAPKSAGNALYEAAMELIREDARA